ncbi:zinc ribbon domain-containing protein [Bacillus cereus group sp. N34]|uniref:zinc ribbon domain-containing protein n=1 Tax=Bacillus cereus group sp. N34 TaxID=2794595 RepID=UPI0018F7CAA7|nr:zinc ribbon domain-containing protein [Bacillus cereus group sp. N34]MBJ8016973.1 zinc ribbon domain-containing protein [Bacillus cereus group sp. N34]
MSDLQSKFGNGMNKLQEGIEQGKMKLQVAQEMAQLKKITQEKLQEKTEILLELGQTVYMQLRDDEVRVDLLKAIVAPVQELDVAIYNTRRQISNLQRQEQKGQCSCGGPLSLNDKFCGQCGKENELLLQSKNIEKEACSSCGEQIATEVTFCPACGMKQSKE